MSAFAYNVLLRLRIAECWLNFDARAARLAFRRVQQRLQDGFGRVIVETPHTRRAFQSKA